MPERAEHIPSPPPLDEQVDRLLADSDSNIDATADAADLDAMEFASPDELLDQLNDSMQTLAAETDAAAAALVESELAEAELAEAGPSTEEAAAAIEASEPPPTTDLRIPPAPHSESVEPTAALAGARPEQAPAPPPAAADDFSSPETITRLDERLAANAQALSDAAPAKAATARDKAASDALSEAVAADEVDDAEIQSQIAAEEAAQADKAPEPVAESDVAPPPAAAKPTPTPAAPISTAAAAPLTPAPKPEAAHAPALPKPARQFHIGAMLAAAAAAVVRPIANYTQRLSPTVRQTIGYAALVTIFQAACLWGFLVFRGPPADPAPAGDPMVLRKVGDDAEHAARMKAAAAHAKPAVKPESKPESKGKSAAKSDSHGGH